MRFQNFFSKINISKTDFNKRGNINKNVKTYLFFLIFTAFLWCALQFSKNYSKEIEFQIEYTKTDADKLVEVGSDTSVSLILEGNGFQLLKFYIFNNKLQLDTKKATVKSASDAYFTGKKMINIFKSALNYDGKITYSSKDTISLKYSKIITKAIPLKIVNIIQFSAGYTSLKGVETLKKEVKVTGAASILDTLKFIKTRELKLSGINKDYTGFVSLETNKVIKQLKIQDKKIPVSIKVDKLTEGEFTLPIKIVNVPKGQRVQLFPKEVTVVFGVTLKDYSQLKASDFLVEVNLGKANKNSNTLGLKLVKKPNQVFNARLSEKEVQYIVVK